MDDDDPIMNTLVGIGRAVVYMLPDCPPPHTPRAISPDQAWYMAVFIRREKKPKKKKKTRERKMCTVNCSSLTPALP